MTQRTPTFHPLTAYGTPAPPWSVQASASRIVNVISFTFRITGAAEGILLPMPALMPKRKDGLWQHTCFEAFLSPRGESRYWEINLSPSGDWNAYAFDAYRVGQRPEARISGLDAQLEPEGHGALTCRITVSLGDLVAPGTPLDAGLTAVIESVTGEKSYWALAHRAERPDFHRRDSFTLSLDAK